MVPASANLSSVWAADDKSAYTAGSGGVIEHWDGSRWSAMDSGTSNDLFDIWGTGQGDVFAVGSNGTILHLGKDSRWTSMASPTNALIRSVKGSGPGNVFALSDGLLLHLRGAVWESIGPSSAPGVYGTKLTSLGVTPNSVYLGLQGISSATGQYAGGTFRLGLTGITCQAPELNCDDGWDNDCDGLQDAADPDCKGKVVEQCANLIDDDGDGLVDCADPDCSIFPACKHR
jgi:hypothetical protein